MNQNEIDELIGESILSSILPFIPKMLESMEDTEENKNSEDILNMIQ